MGKLIDSHFFLVYALLAGAYLLGSIPSGVLLTRAFGAADPRRHGSGNIGATNVTRVGGLGPGLATLAADLLKGVAPVWLCEVWAPDSAFGDVFPVVAALLAFFGHLFPVYSRFRGGGKGVATALGAFFPIAPSGVLAAVLVFAAGFLVVRRVSFGSLVAAVALPVAVQLASDSWAAGAGAALASIFIFIRHAENIRRLIAGTEPVFRLTRRRH